MESVNLLEPVIRAANAANAKIAGDYMKDGLLYCGECHTPKQCVKTFFGKRTIVGCMCSCAAAKYTQEEAERRQREKTDRVMRMRNAGIISQKYRDASFEKDDGKNPEFMRKLRNYAENWSSISRDNIGLLLYGDTGTGKSYGAACIANYLIDRNIAVCMINLSTVLNYLGGFPSEDKNTYIEDLTRYPLLILDDFGMERQTEYALEQVFNIIDARCGSKKPVIITTNISVADIRNPRDIAHRRIFDRITEMCPAVILANGPSRRAEIAAEKTKIAAKLLCGGSKKQEGPNGEE